MLTALEHAPWVGSHVEPIAGLDPADAGRLAGCFGVQQGQPERTPDRGASHAVASVGVVADLELHDRQSLGAALGPDRSDLDHCSDAQLVARGYLRWGDRVTQRLLGDGAFILWDGRQRRLLAWRDVAGTRPLYYSAEPHQAVLSSDLRSLTASGLIERRLDLAYGRSFSEDEQFQHPTRTMVAGISKLAPGHQLTWRPGTHPVVTRVWDPRDVERRHGVDHRELVEELRELTRTAVRCRIPDRDAVVGAHLSGGLDSSSISVIANAHLETVGSCLEAGYSWAPPYAAVARLPEDERELAQAVARASGIDLRFTTLEVGDVDRFVYRDIALRPRSTLDFELGTSRAARVDGVTTMLSGWGGDETVVFNGRGYFADLARRGRLLKVHRELRAHAKILKTSELRSWRSRVMVPLVPDRVFRWRQRPSRAATSVPAELLPDATAAYARTTPLSWPSLRERAGVRRMQVDLLEWGHLSYRMESWASHGADIGLHYRFPMLDRRLIEFALSLPDDAYFKEGWKRRLFREAAHGILPDEVRWNPNKFDTAAVKHLRRVRPKVAAIHRERLMERLDNPFVDVRMLIEAFDHITEERRHGREPKRPEHLGRAMWMAFVDLEL